MLEIGMVIEAQAMILRIVDMRCTWVKLEYWDAFNEEWKPRAYTEKKSYVEEKLRSKEWKILEK